MPQLDLNGIEVNFPFDPYPCQVDYMKAVIECVTKNKNGILESPTGTGKTLCLLCSTISWLMRAKADMQFAAIQGEIEEQRDLASVVPTAATNLPFVANKSGMLQDDALKPGLPPKRIYPKIIYASRTHSQLSQVVKELKMTQYNNIKTCVIGSREQLCINPQVVQQKNYTTKLNMCKAKVNAKTCFFYNNLEMSLNDLKLMNTVDIEDLISFGNKNKCCPYYTSRQLKDTADILFMPYNYLLDKKLRKSNNIEIANSVIIFDEAHNVERVCEDSASTELSVAEIASAMSEIKYILEEMKTKCADDDDENSSEPFKEIDNGINDDFYPSGSKKDALPTTLDELKDVLVVLKAIEDQLDQIQLNAQGGLTKTSSYLFELLNKCGINVNNAPHIFDIVTRLLQYFGAQPSNPRHHNGASLGKFYDFLQTVFSDSLNNETQTKKMSSYYKVHIANDINQKRVIYYWCLSPGYAMKELLNEGARCVILTSGTLSPISSLKEEMKIPFDITLENPHIIQDTQLKVLALRKGPDANTVLSSVYKNRESEPYLQSLGQCIVSFARMVPHGVLVFFPSYRVLDSCVEFWRKNTQLKQMGDLKQIYIESKSAKECQDTVQKYYERIKSGTGGALMFAVCRGKISEGIDFADNNGRAVILTGLPYPMVGDPRVQLKRQYLDENRHGSNGIDGNTWYNQQAYRAVNQAIGRVIRHRMDYGAILLCDERFSQATSINQLPAWIKGRVKKMDDFGVVVSELAKFFNIAIESFPLPKSFNKPTTNTANKFGDKGCCSKNQEFGKENMMNIFGAYKTFGSTSTCSMSATGVSTSGSTLYDALEATSHSTRKIEYEMSESSSNKHDFKSILEERRKLTARMPSDKCKVVIKETAEVAKTNVNPQKLGESRDLLTKISSKLPTEAYDQFKVALKNYHAAKKNDENEKKIQYYKVLRTLFSHEPELFKEVEAFIGIKQRTSNDEDQGNKNAFSLIMRKRKLDQCGE